MADSIQPVFYDRYLRASVPRYILARTSQRTLAVLQSYAKATAGLLSYGAFARVARFVPDVKV